MSSRLTILIVLLLSLGLPLQSNAELVKIGVLSTQGFHGSMKQWQDTANYLTARVPEHVFQVLPYSQYVDLETDMKKNKLDFLLAPRSELSRFITDFSVVPLMSSRMEKKGTQWSLTRKRQLPYSLTFSVSEALLKLPAKHKALNHAGISGWQLSESAPVAFSSNQKLKQFYTASTELASAVFKQHWTIILSILVSGLLLLAYRKWDHYHERQAKIKSHRQQANDPSLSDTVY